MKKLPKDTRICKYLKCENIFECRRKSAQKYCSFQCSRKAMIGKSAWNKGKQIVEREARICPNCGTVFEVTVISVQKYCCGRCWREDSKGKTGPKSLEVRRRIGKANSKTMKKLWQDPEYISMQMIARNVCPNKAEKFLTQLFRELFPNEYKFVGDGTDKDFIIAGKCPDFVNVNGQKKIIELFGEPFHEPEEEQQRINLFAQHGYLTLIIWYKELRNVDLVIQKISEFNKVDEIDKIKNIMGIQ